MKAPNLESDILATIRARFIERGTTLTQWCRGNGVDPARACRVLQGLHLGPKGKDLRQRIATAARGDVADAA